jgi:hypothetical protein
MSESVDLAGDKTSSASSAARGQREKKRAFRGQRGLTVALRAMHLIAVMWLGASLHGASSANLPVPANLLGGLVLGSGALMFAFDLISYPNHLRQVSGWSVVIKLGLVVWLVASESLPIFWLIMAWSAVFSHAPASLRHYTLFPR